MNRRRAPESREPRVDPRSTLVLLTQTYPYGRASETFLDPELPILARRFAQVIVVPSYREDHVRQLPPGVRCETFLADASRPEAHRQLLRHGGRAVAQYCRGIVGEGAAAAYLRHPRTFVSSIGRNVVRYRLLKRFVEAEALHKAVFYDYWLENSTLALSWLRREGVLERAVARAHGFDLYDDQWEAGAVPFRGFKLASLDRVFPISAHGLTYLADRHPAARAKLTLSRLGVEPQTTGTRRHEQQPLPLVVSCGGLKAFKRVGMIPAVLAAIGRPVRWVHFGEGPDRVEVERQAKASSGTVNWQLAGHVDHADVLDFYRDNRVDLFISLSTSEGLPVSIMEAISFGIPVLATAVNGVPEIVTASTGRLVSLHDSTGAIADAARQLLAGGAPSEQEIVSFFKANFEAEKNFTEFAEMLHGV